MKRALLLFLVGFLAVSAAWSEDLIDPGQSNQYLSTQGHEENELDWLISPLGVSQFADSRLLFFALDGNASQFAADEVAYDGIRGGWAGPLGGMTATAVINYWKEGDYDSEPAGENVELQYVTFNGTTYDDIFETVSVESALTDSNQELAGHLGLDAGLPIGLALQVLWVQDRLLQTTLNYENQYQNATEPTETQLVLKDVRTETAIDMREDSRNELTFEPEIGISTGSFSSRIALGAGLVNLLGANSYTRTETTYDQGGNIRPLVPYPDTDDTVEDLIEQTEYSGWWYWNAGPLAAPYTAGTAPAASFDMDLAASPVRAPHVELNLFADNELSGIMDGTLEFPVTVMYNLYPADAQTVQSTTTTAYDDSTATPQVIEEETITVTTTMNSVFDLYADAGARFRKSFDAGSGVGVNLGAGLVLSGDFNSMSKSRETVTEVQFDGDGDGEFDNAAGGDEDTVTRQYGYSIDASETTYAGTVDLPVSVSYQPAPLFDFHAGVTTTMTVDYRINSSTTTGDAGYTTEDFTDNLDSANSYTGEEIANSDDSTLNDLTKELGFNFATNTAFGVTMNLSEQLKVDALGTGFGGAGLDAFTLTAIWSY